MQKNLNTKITTQKLQFFTVETWAFKDNTVIKRD